MTAADPKADGSARAKTLGLILPRDARDADKRELACLYRKAREASGLSQRELATRLGVQPKFVATCELDDWDQTFSTQHLMRGPTEWSVPIMMGIAGHHRAQLLESVEAVPESHPTLLAEVTGECMGVMHTHSLLVAKLPAPTAEAPAADLEAAQAKTRGGLKTLLRLDRKLTVGLMRARGGR